MTGPEASTAAPDDEHLLAAMRRALVLAATPGVPLGPNPRVGCVLLDDAGVTIAEGHHRGAGTPHAEVDALRAAGERARGATAVVTLEPCDHTGRTGPCSRALVEAGVRSVVFAQPDPNPQATGGADTLRAAGVEVRGGLLAEESEQVNRVWSAAMRLQRPFVTWKAAATLDARTAAADGSSRWISNAASRREVHRLRAEVDAVLVGAGTLLADDPALTVRDHAGRPVGRQPLRAVMGERPIPAGARLLAPVDGAEPALHLATRDPHEALAALWGRERRHVLLEGGATLAAAFLAAGLVDEIVLYLAPLLLGAGPSLVGDLGITGLAAALPLRIRDLALVGDDAEPPNVRLVLEPRKES
ncbi:bifunctional diaminohydroxyphosphoribosylaminopyrimidine deaminase/5-amino-6-(5-phosphoribosylamino)uracil reductase RibD [Nocardioides sp. TRM66260-LWL]|uniref:bifunctional diaminohydroxyphosphoribosylaminopyrimidine deaminase/5-amino-6-(5-phosphoribosylamino)uracil reductase RibD n=1 Tax=Nocardioides sp. TRM66260-LWL TaxID=2874478 RepID=UPI001CC39FB3|nr:bifunctional diaminohydroxyphosphoribosylaminopyrimidine deaminase/5-amino-6-(5-phosphoribosylamino)uracil reductase RibD [Nocardioides sp. TRM66260-LWL]MBZ5733868.1 bifunctional diaminohydroxyphosphoribosylaminopyrimidine deaminase/5-amino-6-(5-phosphoribosylamino)uracil reductase RibD [Nocardioides sp. TRM66260-LWL]